FYSSLCLSVFFFFLSISRPPPSPLFPYTTLFRSFPSVTAPTCWPMRPSTCSEPAGDMGRSSRFTVSGWERRPDQRLISPTSSRRSEEHTSELQSPCNLVCRLLLEKKKK